MAAMSKLFVHSMSQYVGCSRTASDDDFTISDNKRLYNVLPVPESFYGKDALQLRPGCHVYLASPGSIAVYSLLLYALSGGAFAALFATTRCRRNSSPSLSCSQLRRARGLTCVRRYKKTQSTTSRMSGQDC